MFFHSKISKYCEKKNPGGREVGGGFNFQKKNKKFKIEDKFLYCIIDINDAKKKNEKKREKEVFLLKFFFSIFNFH